MQRCITRMIFITTLLMLIVPGWSMEKPHMSLWSTGIVLAVVLMTVLAPGRGQEPTSDPDLTKEPTLYIVGYAHLDTQWNWDYPRTIREMIPKTMHDNFRLFELYPHYVFSFSGANRYRMMKEYFPADYEKVKQYVAAGRWFPCGSSMEECDVNVPSAESIIRQVLYGNYYFRRELGKDSAEFMLPDCFGFPASLPSILGHCGIKGFSTQKLSWQSAVGIPFHVGVWEGLDGIEILAALDAGDYNGKVKEDLSIKQTWLDRISENGKKYGVYADYNYYGVGDEGGAPTEESVKWVERSTAGAGPVRVISATAEQMFLDIPAHKIGDLPRYKGDLLLVQHSEGSISSAAYMKRWNRKNELLADAAERASVLAEWIGGPAYPRQRLNDAWTLVMGGQFHDILPGTSITKAYEYSWNDEILALNQFAGVLDNAVGTIANGLDTKAQGVPLIVYNPLSIERQDVVEATVTFPGAQPKAVRVLGPDGKEVPSQILSANNNTLTILFLAIVPSVGHAVYDAQPVLDCIAAPSPLSVTESSLENARYRVTLDNNGDVASIFDKTANRELLSAPARLAFQHENPSGWPAWAMDWEDQQKPPRAYVAGPAQVRIVERGPVRVAIEVVRESEGSRFIQTIRLAAGDAGDRVEFANTIDWRSRECALKAVFPLTVANPMATYNWGVGTIERGNNDPKKYEVPAHQWFDLTDTKSDYGVTVLSDCKYGSDKPDDQTLRLTLIYTPGIRSGSFLHQGTQDFGLHEILYGLAGHSGDWRKEQTDWQALRLEQPLIAFQTTPHDGRLGRAFSLLKLDNPRVRVMAVKKAEEGDEIIVRLVELNGKPAKDVHVAFATPIASAREVNGQEQPIGDAQVVTGELVTDIAGYRLRTFALKLGAAPAQLASTIAQPVQLVYDRCVTSCDGQKSNRGFDSDGLALPGEMLPREIAYRGVVLKIGPEDEPNAVTCQGQTIELPQGKFNRLYLLAASSGGDRKATFSMDGRPTELTIQGWRGYIGQWDNRLWKGGSKDLILDQEPSDLAGFTPAYVRPDPVAWFCSHHHTADGQNAIYEYCYLFAYAVDLPVGAKVLTLPNDNRIRILAATAAEDAGIDTHPAQPLYDELKRDNTLDLTISPAGE